MSRDEFANVVLQWACGEGWNPGIYDYQSFLDTDQTGFLIGYLDEKPIGCISAVCYDEKFAFLGSYLVVPKHRGKGFGMRMWHKGMEHIGDRNIGLDAVIKQQENYKKSGFRFAHKNFRYCGIVEQKTEPSDNLVDIKQVPFEELVEYDSQMFPTIRSDFLKRWITQIGNTGLAHYHNGRLSGYGIIRPCILGYKIGPLFADGSNIAKEIITGLTQSLANKTQYFVDIPKDNPQALDVISSHNMKKVFESARMYSKENPKLPLERIFGITSLELG